MKYGFKVSQMTNEGKTFWIVESTELKGCVAQGDTIEEALKDFEQNEVAWLEAAKEYGIPIPKPQTTQNEYSGKFTIRIAKSIHKKLTELACEEGISLNQLVNDILCEGIGYKRAYKDFTRQRDDDLSEIKNIISSSFRYTDLKEQYSYNPFYWQKGGLKCH